MEESTEYRRLLPAWRIAFDDAEGLHVMDWRDHEIFNTGLLIVSSLTALSTILAGSILFPYRWGWIRRRNIG